LPPKSSNRKVSIAKIGQRVEDIYDILKDIKDDVKLNTEFRIMSSAQANMIKYAVGSGWFLFIILVGLQIAGVI